MKDLANHRKDHREGGCKGKHHRGAQTFRRGRALEFLERLNVKYNTLRQQLESTEFQEIKQVILGELKAIEMVIEEYTKHFELHEREGNEQVSNQKKRLADDGDGE
ncbi:hypothetical protein JOD43_001393 [Pullulanibacillus pueri]|uniref:2-keto-3-deoxygluconate kinase n=1 Tax=Pullulanibacillus pueri TaxID=1437324 RepID=A0A8J3ELC5_9BACL|nr:hypothetical protein [Pullulanibacillus pueri]MBM7681226.1 hypothetical protein [Pullulanibacillus pueri]GGH77967.1 hypothetical protein GCM10007096_10650 [Pullulanibacillus pueri]